MIEDMEFSHFKVGLRQAATAYIKQQQWQIKSTAHDGFVDKAADVGAKRTVSVFAILLLANALSSQQIYIYIYMCVCVIVCV